MCYHNPLGKYFNIELKSIVAQHENLATKGIFGVGVHLQLESRLDKSNYLLKKHYTMIHVKTMYLS